ncbi:MAG TPA: family 16 glycoside hydrolase, partial [Prolixibacteraceae bacterium]|nr:family 16 glycoside hydrolase [Prolixibacteraceae bacterium]
VIKVDASNVDKFCSKTDISASGEGFLLKNEKSAISSNFKVRNFEFTAKLKTTAGAEGVLVFAAPDASVSEKGYAVKINNSDYRVGSPQKTGSLLKIRNNFVRTAADNEWFNVDITVNGSKIKVTVNNKIISEYDEPANVLRSGDIIGRVLSNGFLTIRKTNADGELVVAEMTILPLGDEVKPENIAAAEPDSIMKVVDLLNQQEFPLIDFHGHLKGGLTMDQACQHARDIGYNYGIAANCGLKFPVTSDSTLNAYLDGISNEPVFKVMQCEGREWVTLFTPAAVARFDYIFTDAMTWTDNKGRRLRLWIPEETFVEDEQEFMDMLVGKIEAIMANEPVDIYVNPSFLPAKIAADYDRLWTPERMDRVVNVLKNNDVALEINARYKIPSIAFLKRAKAAGVKFTFGTNNTTNTDLGRLEYCLKAISELGLTADDIFLPRSTNDKKVMKSGLPSKITG